MKMMVVEISYMQMLTTSHPKVAKNTMELDQEVLNMNKTNIKIELKLKINSI